MSAVPLNAGVHEQAYRTLFNADWYLKQYPDVAAAGMDPWQHFTRHGMDEQRLPCPVEALSLEEQLWQGDSSVLAPLHKLAKRFNLQGAVAGWVLARWYAAEGRFAEAEPLINYFFTEPAAQLIVRHAGPYLLRFSLFWQQNKMTEAERWLSDPHWPEVTDWALAKLMLPQQHKLLGLNEFFQSQGLCPIALRSSDAGLTLDNLTAYKTPDAKRTHWWQRQPLISIIIPCYNAEDTIGTTLRSLQQQSWKNLEILVVDDASTDNSAELVVNLAAQDNRITLLRHPVNQGAYAARNSALAVAKGQFITVHDSDDWSHPQKIERQANELLMQPKVIATISYLVRCSSEIYFTRWRMESSWISLNLSSLMFRKSILKKIGYWDRVSVGADSEFYNRITKLFGTKKIKKTLPGTPLTFARTNSDSLTQNSNTHLRTLYIKNGLRRRFNDAALQWHNSASARQLYLPQFPKHRPFAVPVLMCRGTALQQKHNLALLAEQSELFDAAWYLSRYPDVATAGMDPWQHYLHHGHNEGRDPSPRFSGSGYQFAEPDAREHNPLLHLLNTDQAMSYTLPLHQGQLTWQPGRPALLLCAHQVSAQCYGAERSLLDVLHALATLPYNLVVTLPSAMAVEYVEQIAALSHRFMIMPYAWWHANRGAEPDTVQHFVELIQQCDIKLVYCNTLTLLEPLVAAKQANIPSITHVRELPEHDLPLCDVLRCDPVSIRQHLLEHTDFFIANSKVVANYLNAAQRTTTISNVIATSEFDLPYPAYSRVQLGMISSNLPKKGLSDFVELSALLQAQHLPVDCVLIGPENEHTHAVLAKPDSPSNLRVAGYMPSAQAAISQLDVLVNLSHVQESFGRTVLEAMAASRPVVCYEWGALPELVEQGKSGFLAPLGDIAQVAEYVAMLVGDEALRNAMGQAGQARAQRFYSPSAMQQAFASLLQAHTGPLNNKEKY